MNRQRSFLALTLFILLAAVPAARAQQVAQRTESETTTRTTPRTYTVSEGGPFFGIDLGVAEPTDANFRHHVQTGASLSPFIGYMMNDYLGIQSNLYFNFFPPDNDHRAHLPGQTGLDNENRYTTMAGLTIGPRLSIPLGDMLRLYATGQGGGFKGLGGRLNQLAPGFSVGGGLDFDLTRNFSIGLFGRYNRAYMAPHPYVLVASKDLDPKTDAQWASAGISLNWNFKEAPPPPPPPPPPPVAQAPPPPPPTKEKIVLRAVHFDFNKATIRSDARPILDEAVRMLKERKENVVVEGHTDSVGGDAYNMKLSRRRADAVKRYLTEHGIAASRITTEGFGKRQPVASNATAEGRAQNRRVEIHVQ